MTPDQFSPRPSLYTEVEAYDLIQEDIADEMGVETDAGVIEDYLNRVPTRRERELAWTPKREY